MEKKNNKIEAQCALAKHELHRTSRKEMGEAVITWPDEAKAGRGGGLHTVAESC